MRKMKDSGTEVIGCIPDQWSVCRIKQVSDRITDGTHGTYQRVENGRLLLSAKNVFEDGLHICENESMVSEEDYAQIVANGFPRKNDILLCCVGTVGRCGIFEYNEPIAFQRSVVFIRCTKRIMPRFMLYSLQSPSVLAQERQYINKSAQEGIYQGAVKELKITLPPLEDQIRIIDYLDEKCSKIDTIIARQEEIIEKLKEYKLSIITEAVTKGVNSEVEMKESGIDICKKIPINWKASQIRNLFQLRDEKNYKPLEEVQLLSLYTDLGVFPHGEQEERGNKAVKAEGYKVVYDGDIVVNIILAWMGAIGRSAYNGVTSPAYDIYKPLTGVCSEYYHYMFRTKAFSGECYKYGRGIMAMRWRTYSSEFKSIKVPVPPYEEQKTIAKYLDKKCSMLDKTINDRKSAIEKLQDYKKSLIYEVVTGKKEV